MVNCGISWSGEQDSKLDFITSISDFRNLFYRDDNSRRVRLSNEERKKILNVCNASFHPVVFTAMEIALRRSEIITMKWEQVDLENGIVYVHRRKKRRFVVEEVPLTKELWETFKELKKSAKSDYVFTNTQGNPYTDGAVHSAWKRVRKKAGLPELRFHDLRKLAPSALIRSGYGVYAAKTLLGHTDVKVTERYIATDVESLRNALDSSKEKSPKK